MDQFQDPERRSAAVAEIPAISRIPLRHPAGAEYLALTPADIILGDGDVAMIEARDSEVFYTGGLLRGGQFQLPRDYDLDVLGAIAMAGGSIGRAAGGTATSGSVTIGRAAGIVPPTTVVILRVQNGQQVAIHVDLKKVMRHPEERVLIQPNDFIGLEYTTAELWADYALGSAFFSFSGPLWKL